MIKNPNSKPPIKRPPQRSKNLLSDIWHFLLRRPLHKTLVKYHSPQERKDFSQRIMQRIGVVVGSYSILDVHRIAIEAPVQVIFDELLKWDGDSTCWPNHLAQVHRVNNSLKEIEILLFGFKKLPFDFFTPLFRLNAIRIQRLPATSDYDNARYLLYRCSGGYPIGVFSMYVRSSIPRQNEQGQSQLFMAVGFDFYGRKTRFKYNPINKIWELMHDRVTANMLNRLKQLCEWRFEKIKKGN